LVICGSKSVSPAERMTTTLRRTVVQGQNASGTLIAVHFERDEQTAMSYIGLCIEKPAMPWILWLPARWWAHALYSRRTAGFWWITLMLTERRLLYKHCLTKHSMDAQSRDSQLT